MIIGTEGNELKAQEVLKRWWYLAPIRAVVEELAIATFRRKESS
jgi:hypothetical protein